MPKFNSKEAIEKFYVVIKKGQNNLCAAYLIGNVLCSDNASTLEEVKLKILSKEITIQALWQYIANIPPSALMLKSKTNKASLNAFKNWIIGDIELLKSIGKQNLIILGMTEANYTRIVLIALIQEHSAQNNEAFVDFNYALITQGSAEHTYLCVRPIINKCPELPIEAIKLLGQSTPKIAQDILYDLPPTHQDTPEIAEFFYTQHEALRPKIILKKIASAPVKSLSLIDKFYTLLFWLLTKIKSGLYYFSKSSHSDKEAPLACGITPNPIIKIVIEPVKKETLNKDVPSENRTENRTSSRHN